MDRKRINNKKEQKIKKWVGGDEERGDEQREGVEELFFGYRGIV